MKSFGIAVLFANLSMSGANATVLRFDDIGGKFNDPYSGHTEQGFEVAPSYGSWHKYIDTRNGSPYRAIFAGPLNDVQPCGLVIRRTDGGLFHFTSIYGIGDGGGALWRFIGWRNDEEMFNDYQSFYPGESTYTIRQTAQIDRLTIDISQKELSYPAYLLFDDITVEPVPEPSTLAAIGGGILFVTGRRRKRT